MMRVPLQVIPQCIAPRPCLPSHRGPLSFACPSANGSGAAQPHPIAPTPQEQPKTSQFGPIEHPSEMLKSLYPWGETSVYPPSSPLVPEYPFKGHKADEIERRSTIYAVLRQPEAEKPLFLESSACRKRFRPTDRGKNYDERAVFMGVRSRTVRLSEGGPDLWTPPARRCGL